MSNRHFSNSWSRIALIALLVGAGSFTSATADDELNKLQQASDIAALEQRARAGEAEAQASLARALRRNGQSAEALKWGTAAAEQNHVGAILQIAEMHRYGVGTSRDLAEVARWYERAAKLGNISAQGGFADALLHGQGIARNEREAAKWYAAAARQGGDTAFLSLAKLYATGTGVERDPVEALALASIAREVLDLSNFQPEIEASDLAESLERQLTDAQVDAALARAREWRPDYDELVDAKWRQNLKRWGILGAILAVSMFVMLAVVAVVFLVVRAIRRGTK